MTNVAPNPIWRGKVTHPLGAVSEAHVPLGGVSLTMTHPFKACGLRQTRNGLAAGIILNQMSRWSTLKAWDTWPTWKIGHKMATVGVAGKLAIILHHIWHD